MSLKKLLSGLLIVGIPEELNKANTLAELFWIYQVNDILSYYGDPALLKINNLFAFDTFVAKLIFHNKLFTTTPADQYNYTLLEFATFCSNFVNNTLPSFITFDTILKVPSSLKYLPVGTGYNILLKLIDPAKSEFVIQFVNTILLYIKSHNKANVPLLSGKVYVLVVVLLLVINHLLFNGSFKFFIIILPSVSYVTILFIVLFDNISWVTFNIVVPIEKIPLYEIFHNVLEYNVPFVIFTIVLFFILYNQL